MSKSGPLLFNPSRASVRELETTFVGRWQTLKDLEEAIRRDIATKTARHWYIIGPRGAGKTHLTQLLALRLERDQSFCTVRLPEEHYQVTCLADLLEEIAVRAGAMEERTDDSRKRVVEERALDALRQFRDRTGKPFLCVIENFNALLERQITQRRDVARMRELLMTDPPFTVIASASTFGTFASNYENPFYDFFQVVSLPDLSQDQLAELIETRATWDEESDLLCSLRTIKGRVSAVFHLSGGNPRLALTLYGVLREGVSTTVHGEVMQLLDEVTPYYQAIVGQLSPQAAKVLVALASSPEAATPAMIAKDCRLATNQVTANIARLVKYRLVRAGARPDLRRRYYEISDRLLRIWLQMREEGSGSRRLAFLAEFFERWYAEQPEEMASVAARVATELWAQVLDRRRERCAELLATLEYLQSVLPTDTRELLSNALFKGVSDIKRPLLLKAASELIELSTVANEVRQRDALTYAAAVAHIRLDNSSQAKDILHQLVSTTENPREEYWSEYVELVDTIDGGVRAYHEGLPICERFPQWSHLAARVAYFAVRANEIDESKKLFRQAIVAGHGEYCRFASVRIYLMALQTEKRLDLAPWAIQEFVGLQGGVTDKLKTEILAIQAFVAMDGPDAADVKAAMGIVSLWPNLENVPLWVLGELGCRIAHKDGGGGLASTLIRQYASTSKVGTHGGLVRHMLLAYLDLIRTGGEERVWVDKWLLERVPREELESAFTHLMPRIAKQSRLSGTLVLEAYARLADVGALGTEFPPYSVARKVVTSESAERTLESLHPEMREAVELLLSGKVETPSARPPDMSMDSQLRTTAGNLSKGRKKKVH